MIQIASGRMTKGVQKNCLRLAKDLYNDDARIR